MVVRMSLMFVALTALVLATVVVQAKEWETELQKQVAFFDRNGDGVIYPEETFEGVRAIGGSIDLANALSVIINTAISGRTRPGKPPSPKFPIEIENIKLAKNPSDTASYDVDGRFEEVFSKYGHTKPGALSSTEIDEMLKATRRERGGGFFAYLTWKLLFKFVKDEEGFLPKESARKVYDGTIFYELEKQNKEKLASKK